MTLISCPECGKEISDRVKACQHCGYPLHEDTGGDVQQVEIRSVKIPTIDPKQKSRLMIILGGLIAALLIGFLVFGAYQKNAAKAYAENLDLARTTMLIGGAEAETLLNLTGRVWFNTIYEERDSETDEFTGAPWFNDDFNVSLGNLFSDSGTLTTIKSIVSNQDRVAEIMKDLQNPPKDLEMAYQTASELYATYKGLTDLAIDPKGSLQTFSEDKNTKIGKFMELYDKLGTQIPETE